ncbi:MAG: septal ring lytic transglycosylase RlpA family protein [Parvularcula sp.]|jgi:rare lipoprotein A|nr:septal ring lytic transglycosylase RlpA family protein [Parvularcula sp.]
MKTFQVLPAAVLLGVVTACSTAKAPDTAPVASIPPAGTSAGKAATKAKTLQGIASFYAASLDGNRTANGETYDHGALTAAHKTLPFGTKLKVTNLENGKSVIVTVNDRGPYAKGRILDLSGAAARALGMIETGTARIRAEILS